MPTINGTGASETLTGGSDADIINDEVGGNDILRGMGGNDTLHFWRGQNAPINTLRAEGGDGDDLIDYYVFNASNAVLDGGAGNDRFLIWAAAGNVEITTGAGADILDFSVLNPTWGGQIVVTDFTAGFLGDRIVWDSPTFKIFDMLTGWNGGNPFASGHLKLTQVGADAVLSIDLDGAAGAQAALTLITFRNVQAHTLVAWNFGGLDPNGGGVPGQTFTGTAAADRFFGTNGDDIMTGADGDDLIQGRNGNDRIEGGAGNDSLGGGDGDDIIYGGAGNDTIGGGDGVGNDLYDGGEGDDYISAQRFASSDHVRLYGGDGADELHINGDGPFSALLDGGAGNDRIYLDGFLYGDLTIATGAGVDTIHIGRFENPTPTIRVTDFTAGTGGDVLNFQNMLNFSLVGWNGYNPFQLGFTRLVQDGANVLLMVDRDGSGTVHDWITLITFADTLRTDFTAANFGYNPLATPGQLYNGTAENDVFNGAGGDDVMQGNNGDDVLNGDAGDDSLMGGSGRDILAGGEGNDRLDGGQGGETSPAELGGGQYRPGGDVADYRTATRGVTVSLQLYGAQDTGQGLDTLENIEDLYGSQFDDILTGTVIGSNLLEGFGGADRLTGDNGNDILLGGDGDDILNGGFGNDILEGGAGFDIAVYAGPRANYTIITNAEGVTSIIDNSTYGQTDTLRGVERLQFADGLYTTAGERLPNIVNGTPNADNLVGDSGVDHILAGDGDDTLTGGAGNDTLDGGAGRDTAVFSGARSAYTLSITNGVTTVVGPDGTDTLTNIERLRFDNGLYDLAGNPLPNEINGTSYADTLNGTAGADLIAAGDGDDVITGGAGNDIIDGGAGFDTAVFAAGVAPYSITVSNGVVTVVSSEGVDNLTNVERLRFGAIELAVSALGAGVTLIGTAAGETLTGGTGDDQLFGSAGNDVLNGGAGSDTADYSGAGGGVTARIDLQTASNDGDGGSDTFTSIENLTGSAFNDLLIGDGAANILIGGAGRDVILGGGGDDIIHGGADVPNELYGGAGNDTYIVENRSDSIFENAGEGIDTVLTAVSQINLAAHIENLTYTGTGSFTGVGNAVSNVITGGTGRDVLLGLGGDDILIGGAGAANELYGGAGNDTYVLDVADSIIEGVGDGIDTVQLRALRNYTLGANVENGTVVGTGDFMLNGNALDNVITGGDGNDTLQGGAGNDTLHGGAGIDTLTYILSTAGVTARLDLGRATNDGLSGTDTFTGFENLTGSNLRDTLMGNADNNIIDGAIGNDVLLGFDGDDILIGGSGGGVNEMYGGRGDDLYIVDAADTLIELAGEGIDTVLTTMGNFTLKANIEHLTYVGPGNFGGTGNAENNTITGGAGHDTLAGLGGDDTLVGGAGNDLALLQGVRANYVFTRIEGGWRVVDSVAARDGTDTLLGIEAVRFANGEVLVLSSLIPPAATPEVMARMSDKTLFDDAFVLPPLDDNALVLPDLVADKVWADLPQVLPVADDLFAGIVMDGVAPAHTPLHGHADGFGEGTVRDWMI
ncbi:beta strand repeat-containing protein [Brevundimonas sp.]|uniref:beta strand repeat-containing protein n=1 Tax=Brevundimonas sp. TaxID=1871086 RepID=UPI003F71A18E